MNTKKFLFGIFACATLMIASCTAEDAEVYESGIERKHVTKGTDAIERKHVTKGTDAVKKKDVRKGPTKNN